MVFLFSLPSIFQQETKKRQTTPERSMRHFGSLASKAIHIIVYTLDFSACMYDILCMWLFFPPPPSPSFDVVVFGRCFSDRWRLNCVQIKCFLINFIHGVSTFWCYFFRTSFRFIHNFFFSVLNGEWLKKKISS